MLVVSAHHPDVLKIGGDATPAPAQALTWNVFRTLELMPPAFWLRRFNACLNLEPPRPAPTTARIQLWPELAVAPALIEPGQTRVEADVLIETEHGVWALIVCHGDLVLPARDTAPDQLAMLAHAASWHARRRDCWIGVIVEDARQAPIAASLVRRYRASRHALRLRVPPRSPDLANVLGCGMTTWRDLVTILRDAADADTLDPVERAIAHRTVDWCARLAFPIADKECEECS